MADPTSTIRSLAGRLLAARFAASTLPGVLGEDRGEFVEDFRQALQANCRDLHLGVVIPAIVVEAIHPPVGAAMAYHAVQAAAIAARTSVAEALSTAATQAARARQESNLLQYTALADSADILGAARTDHLLFEADRSAWTANAPAFLLERRLEEVGKALPTRDLVIVDHRLTPGSSPLLDLRGATSLP